MAMSKWSVFGLGVLTGVTAVTLAKKPAFRKACASVAGKALLLKEDALSFAESVKEDAEDALAEARYTAEASQ